MAKELKHSDFIVPISTVPTCEPTSLDLPNGEITVFKIVSLAAIDQDARRLRTSVEIANPSATPYVIIRIGWDRSYITNGEEVGSIALRDGTSVVPNRGIPVTRTILDAAIERALKEAV